MGSAAGPAGACAGSCAAPLQGHWHQPRRQLSPPHFATRKKSSNSSRPLGWTRSCCSTSPNSPHPAAVGRSTSERTVPRAASCPSPHPRCRSPPGTGSACSPAPQGRCPALSHRGHPGRSHWGRSVRASWMPGLPRETGSAAPGLRPVSPLGLRLASPPGLRLASPPGFALVAAPRNADPARSSPVRLSPLGTLASVAHEGQSGPFRPGPLWPATLHP